MKEATILQLRENHKKFCDIIRNMDENKFMYSFEQKWTAGQQIVHIIKSIQPLTKAMALSPSDLLVRFGKSERISLSYQELVDWYRKKLSEGGRSTAQFLPSEISFEQKDNLCNELILLVEKLILLFEEFPDEKLDTCCIPHPLLNNLTIIEMMNFTIYHVEHHHLSTLKNLKNI